MSDTLNSYREQLDQREQQAMDNSDLLFAISYIRSHLDLLSLEDEVNEPKDALIEAVSSTFDTDNMSPSDRAEVVGIIRALS